MPIERPNYVRIVNGLKEKIVARFDGEDYEFLPARPLDVPVVVAAHIFGFGQTNKIPALNRLGWLQSSDQMKAAMSKMQKISFAQAPPLVEAEMPEPDEGSAQRLLPQGKHTGAPVSPETGGGEGDPPAGSLSSSGAGERDIL